jgi:hypothetical protein
MTGSGQTLVEVWLNRCVAVDCGTYSFSGGANSKIHSQFCEGSGAQTGFTIGGASAYWDAHDDYLHDNGDSSQQSNLYFATGGNFRGSRLRLGGTAAYNLYAANSTTGNCTCDLEDCEFSGTVTRHIQLDDQSLPSQDGTRTINLKGCDFFGTCNGSAISNTDAGAATAINLNMEDCRLIMNKTGVYCIQSVEGRATVMKLVNCTFKNLNATGHGIWLGDPANEDVVQNCIIVAGGTGIAKGTNYAGYSDASGYNIISAGTPYATGVSAQTGDVSAVPELDAYDRPIAGGNCDLGRGNPAARAALGMANKIGMQDIYGNPKLRLDLECRGGVYPVYDSPSNIIQPNVERVVLPVRSL